jgi:hypothetical protein
VLAASCNIDSLLWCAGAHPNRCGGGGYHAANLHTDTCAYCNRHAYRHADLFHDTDRHTHTDTIPHAHRNTDRDSDRNANPYPLADVFARSANRIAYGDTQAKTIRAASFGDTQTRGRLCI